MKISAAFLAHLDGVQRPMSAELSPQQDMSMPSHFVRTENENLFSGGEIQPETGFTGIFGIP
jgi:hypothetical protein